MRMSSFIGSHRLLDSPPPLKEKRVSFIASLLYSFSIPPSFMASMGNAMSVVIVRQISAASLTRVARLAVTELGTNEPLKQNIGQITTTV